MAPIINHVLYKLYKNIYNSKYNEYVFSTDMYTDDLILKHTEKLNDDLEYIFEKFINECCTVIKRKDYKLRILKNLSKKVCDIYTY